jgi:hypothetical protein
MPFPGPIIRAYAMHDCWLALWHDPRRGMLNIMYLLGYAPGTHHTRQVMLVGPGNAPVRTVPLRNGYGRARLTGLGRSCAVISYGQSNIKSYYRPASRQVVSHCRWRH